MTLAWSPSTGLLARARAGETPEIECLGQSSWSYTERGWHGLSNIDDWKLLDDPLDEQRLARLLQEHRLSRTVALCLAILQGLTRDLMGRILTELEELSQVGVSEEAVLNHLLIAPLSDPAAAQTASKAALVSNLNAMAGLFEQLVGLQPLLRRLVGHWLALPPSLFTRGQHSQQRVWTALSTQGLTKRLLEAPNAAAFRSRWSELLFSEKSPAGRLQLREVGEELARAVYPSVPVDRVFYDIESEEIDARRVSERDRTRWDEAWRAKRDRALRQITAIAEAVAEGRDAKARRFLRDLVRSQQSDAEVGHAVKSLCNIAQRCAEMFRPDFERVCLEAALTLRPDDPWTQVQWGDHLKRLGLYDEAEKALRFAAKLGYGSNEVVALSSLADVFTERGDFDEATAIYQSISGWSSRVSVRTALADIQRHRGEWDAAIEQYQAILTEWPDQFRPWAGIAEILKQRGSLDEAAEIYDRILTIGAVDESDRIVYSLAKCGILKRQGHLAEALKIVDSVAVKFPFLMQARVQRGAILALLGQWQEGLMGVPASSVPPPAEGWLRAYTRGLILLQLRRLDEARVCLVDQLQGRPVARSGEALVRLAGVLLFLAQNEHAKAEAILEGAVASSDYLANYVTWILQLHLATARRDSAKIQSVLARLQPHLLPRSPVTRAVSELEQNNLPGALRIELELLLSAA